ncbi:MAG: BPSS1780 family membrane protein [Burkholderiales bacterium]
MSTASRSVPARHGWMWVVEGFALFRKSPAVWIMLLLALVVVMKLLVFVPVLGILFVLLMPVFIAGLMEGCRALENGQPLVTGHLLVGFRKNAAQLVTIGGVSLVGNLAIMMIVLSLGGEAMSAMSKMMSHKQPIDPQLAKDVQAAASTVGRALIVGTIVSVPLLMALWYAPLLVYFRSENPLNAMKSSFVACVKNAGSMLIYGLLILLGMFLAMPFGMALGQYDLALWLLAPIVLPSLYVSYKDIFLAGTAPEPGPDSVAS